MCSFAVILHDSILKGRTRIRNNRRRGGGGEAWKAYLVWYSNFLFFSSFWTHCSLNSERHEIVWILLKKSSSAIFPKILMWGWRQEARFTPSHVLMANRREFAPRGQVFPCHVLIIFSTQISCFTQFFIHKDCFQMFLSAHFLFWEILNLYRCEGTVWHPCDVTSWRHLYHQRTGQETFSQQRLRLTFKLWPFDRIFLSKERKRYSSL